MISKSKLEKILWINDIIVFAIVFTLMNFKKFGVIIPQNNYLYLLAQKLKSALNG